MPTNRLTVREIVYHQITGDNPTKNESVFFRPLESDEQPYVRHTKVGEEWEPLDFAWVESVGMLCLKNEEGANPQVIPTEEEKAELAKRVLLLAYEGRHSYPWLIPPGESFRGMPCNAPLRVKAQTGVVKFSVFAIPR